MWPGAEASRPFFLFNMLKFLRKKTKVIVWTVVIAFVGWGGYAVRTQFEGSNRAPGRIFGRDVSFQEYLSAQRIAQIFYAPPKDKESPSAEETEAQIWQFLILSHEAKRQKIGVSDDEVRGEISRFLGGTDLYTLPRQQYLSWVQKEFHSEPRPFEDQVRENLRVRKLLDKIRAGFPDKPEDHMKDWLTGLMVQARPEIFRSRG